MASGVGRRYTFDNLLNTEGIDLGFVIFLGVKNSTCITYGMAFSYCDLLTGNA